MNSDFKGHFEKIKSKLELKLDFKVIIGEEARNIIVKYGGSPNQNGAFIHKNINQKIVTVINTKRIGTLAHEMRHAWQYENKEKYGFDFFNDSPTDKCLYYTSKKELDANQYAFKYCMNNRLIITALEYLGILIGSYVYFACLFFRKNYNFKKS